MSSSRYETLSRLGGQTQLPTAPDVAILAILETVPNSHPDTLCVARFNCPVTGQSNFAHLVIDDLPGQGVPPYRGRG